MRSPFARPALLAAALCTVGLGAFALSACSGNDAKPCNNCPDMSGRWTFHFESGSEPTADCTEQGRTLPDGGFEISQVGSGLTSELEGVPLTGTLYDTFDFGLSGTASSADGGVNSVSLNGRFVPAQAALDAGERLQGSFTGTFSYSKSCVISRGYTATRAP